MIRNVIISITFYLFFSDCHGMRIFDIGPDGLADAVSRIELPNLYSLLKDLYFQGCLEQQQMELTFMKGHSVEAPRVWNSFGKQNFQTRKSGMTLDTSVNDTRSSWVANSSCLAEINNSGFQNRDSIESGVPSDAEKDPAPFSSLSATGAQNIFEKSLTQNADPEVSYVQGSSPKEDSGQAALAQFTLCFWFRTNIFHQVTVVLSYATSFENSNTILVGTVYNQVRLMYHFGRWTYDKNLEPLFWYSLCVKKDPTSISLTLDGEELINRTALLPLPLDGSLVLGNDQDSVGGGYAKEQAFRGKVADLNLWPRSLDKQEVLAVGKCKVPPGRLLAWDQIPWNIHGFVTTEHGDPCKDKDAGVQFTLPESFTRPEGHSFCSRLGLKFPLPTSQSENEYILSMLKNDMDHCRNFFDTVPGVWLRATYNGSAGQYADEETGQVLQFVPLRNPPSDAIIMNVLGEWWATRSMLMKCVLCVGSPNHVPYYLQGFCANETTKENIYSIFYMNGYGGSTFTLIGPSGLEISKNSDKWEMRNRLDNKTLASLQGEKLPFGKRKWTVYDTKAVCGADYPGQHERNLIVSNCQPGNFTCWNGDCVPLSARCSSVRDCLDKSDELDCLYVSTSVGYDKHLPPVSKKLNMIVSLVLTRLNLVDLKYQVVWTTFTLELRWLDPQVNFFNLRENPENNPLDTGELWLPQIKLVNESRFLGSLKPLKRVTVLKEHPGIDIGTDYMYKGSLNHLRYVFEYEANFWCACNLKKYPFDRQRCSINMEITNVPEEVLTYEVGIESSGMLRARDMQRDYFLGNMDLRIKNGSRLVSATFQLIRCPNYQLFTIYLPTIFLHGIGYGTLSISAQDFQDRGAMSLTTMLVLVSLYSEVQSDLPSTAFMKYIDFWFIFSIFFLTLIIVVHLLTNDNSTSLVHQGPVYSGRSKKVFETSWKERLRDNKWVLWLARRVLGIGYLVFQAVYWISLIFA
ncbi:uncharacterized protein [Macrobrachium rosenbergii]|uniref:uncharacterized protein n=1 Tax=Macrobrachium rosenbergii TaxID=79674 RepID=UPI0034D56ED8